jgi:DNA polymerase-3 subunit epsilon
MKPAISPETIKALPDTPGVYLLYGTLGELLYVGKSRAIRTRVRSHFSAPEEKWLTRRIRRIEARRTAGELGALLLESQLIKELRPMFNVASRRRRRIMVARRVEDKRGYPAVELEAVEYLKFEDGSPIMAIFKHRTQAKEYLKLIARKHRLCPKLLGLEAARTYCFSFHLGHCNGACMGEEDVQKYNERFETAFEERRVKAWPYEGGVLVEERSGSAEERELFLLDNWCLVASYTLTGVGLTEHIRGNHRFDYDSYKILLSFLSSAGNAHFIRCLPREEFDRVMKGSDRSLLNHIANEHREPFRV